MILASFLVALAVSLGGLVLAIVRGVELWRSARRVGGALGDELSTFDERSARTERLLAEADRSSAELQAALGRLRVSRARLEVLRAALERATERTRWLRAFLPV